MMEILEYKIKKGDTLETIAKAHHIKIEELINFHNKHCGITQQILSDELPKYMKLLLLSKEHEVNESETLEVTNNKKKARYRAEQINTSKILGSLAHFFQQNFQYVLELGSKKNVYSVKMEDYHFETNPTFLAPSFNFISKTEFIRHNLLFEISPSSGRLTKVLNKKEIYDNWEKFKTNEFHHDEFIKDLEKTNQYAVDELLKMGNTQFAIDYKLAEEEYRRNLFYFILFDRLLVEKIENIESYQFDFMSTVVPPIIVPIEFRYDKISETDNIIKFRKVGTAQLNEQLISEIKQKYDEIHKPTIKFNYTEYKLEFRVRGEFNKETKEIENADLFIIEQIADNIENQCEFHLKKLNNYTI